LGKSKTCFSRENTTVGYCTGCVNFAVPSAQPSGCGNALIVSGRLAAIQEGDAQPIEVGSDILENHQTSTAKLSLVPMTYSFSHSTSGVEVRVDSRTEMVREVH